jgi:hypothetical protein
VAGLFLLMLWKVGFGLSNYEPALLFVLIAWRILARSGPSLSARGALLAGTLVGVAAWFKHDMAAYVGIGIVLGRIVDQVGGNGQRRSSHTIRDALLTGAGAAVMVLPVALWCWIVAGRDAFQDLIWFPLTAFPKVRFAYPGLLPYLTQTDAQGLVEAGATWCRSNIALVLWLGWIVALVHGRFRGTSPLQSGSGFLIPTFAFFWLAAHFKNFTHLQTMSAIILLLGGVAWTRSQALLARLPLRIAASSVALVYGASLLVGPARAAVRVARDWPGSRSSLIPSLWGLRVPARDLEYYEPIASLAQRSVPDDERIYVGLVRHDVIVGANPMVYAVVGRRGASRYDELHPAAADRADVQREIADAIDRSEVRLVVLWQFGWPPRALDQLKIARARDLPNSGSSELDQFLERAYRPIAQYGEYHVLWREPQ